MNTPKVKRHLNSDTKNRQQRTTTKLPPWSFDTPITIPKETHWRDLELSLVCKSTHVLYEVEILKDFVEHCLQEPSVPFTVYTCTCTVNLFRLLSANCTQRIADQSKRSSILWSKLILGVFLSQVREQHRSSSETMPVSAICSKVL